MMYHLASYLKQIILFRSALRSVWVLLFLGICVFLLGACKNEKKSISTAQVEISIWYGDEQTFGAVGHPQKQINILGNIHSNNQLVNAYFILNGSGQLYPLTLGPDLHRLHKTGDFNIEIDRNQLKKGANTVEIQVEKNSRLLQSRKIVVHYQPETNWPLPYKIDWAKVRNIQGAVQVVDGHWELTSEGIRTKDVFYDRVLAFGDATWRNYEVTTTVTFHGYNPPKEGPPTYNVSHVAIASRWPGHDQDSLQPNRKWFPLGATSEFRITDGYKDCRWRIFDGENFYEEQPKSEYRNLIEGKVYSIKHRVEDLSDTETKYSVKLWEADTTEPEQWDFSAIEVSKKPQLAGSCLLLAHHTDVTFGTIYANPIHDTK